LPKDDSSTTIAIAEKEEEESSTTFDYSDCYINPFSLSRMQIAYDSLAMRGGTSSFKADYAPLEATHLYVKYLPANEKEYEMLISDTSITVFDKPLVAEKTMDETATPADTIIFGSKWLYTVVPVSSTMLPIAHEIIDELYQPMMQTDLKNANLPDFWEELQFEAFRQAGYIANHAQQTSLKSWRDWINLKPKLKGYKPKVIVTAYDDAVNRQVPIPKVKAIASAFTAFWVSNTGDNGTATFPKCGVAVNYQIWFQDSKWSIRNGSVLLANIDGPTKAGTWDCDIKSNSKHVAWATIQRACNRYGYKNIGGLARPFPYCMKICYHHKDGSSYGVNWGILWQNIITGTPQSEVPTIKIWKNDKISDLFMTATHELGHAAHITKLKSLAEYATVPLFIYESWATAIEWYISRIEYAELGLAYFENKFRQFWPDKLHDYTPLFIDLVDSYNQSLKSTTVTSKNACPYGGWYDGCNCLVGGAPSGTSAFIYNNSFYYTKPDCACSQTGAVYDGANCWVQKIDEHVLPFTWHNGFYYRPRIKNSPYPYDEISGYTMAQIESKILPYAKGKWALKEKIKSNKPQGITDKHIDLWYEMFQNEF